MNVYTYIVIYLCIYLCRPRKGANGVGANEVAATSYVFDTGTFRVRQGVGAPANTPHTHAGPLRDRCP